jgi:hypothetical protein
MTTGRHTPTRKSSESKPWEIWKLDLGNPSEFAVRRKTLAGLCSTATLLNRQDNGYETHVFATSLTTHTPAFASFAAYS